MFEASINRQFKSRFAALNGAVHMGPISVLRRIFNGHSIDGYVLSNNFEEQLVVMKKREFEALCKYIKVDIERTSNIPRAKLIKERGMRGIDLSNSGGMNPNALIPYRDVTCGSYSNYLNNAYLSQIQPYTHMILRGMNFSHYEVISKAMQSNMANAINQAYEKYGGNINNVLSKRSYNAEEYEVALLAIAYVGIDELNPDYLRVVCANDGSGARAMKNKLDKYRGKDKVEKINKEEIEEKTAFYPNWYIDIIKKYSNKFLGIRQVDENTMDIIVKLVGLDGGFEVRISEGKYVLSKPPDDRVLDVWPYSYLEHSDWRLYFKYSESESIKELEKKLLEKIELSKEIVAKEMKKGYNFLSKDWFKKFMSRHITKFDIYTGNAPTGLPTHTSNFIYKSRGNKYPLNVALIPSFPGSGKSGIRFVPTEWTLKMIGFEYEEFKGLSMDEVDAQIFEVFEQLADYIDGEEAKLAEQNNISEEEKKQREELYENWYINYLNAKGIDYQINDTEKYDIDILLDGYFIKLSRKKTYHNKYWLGIDSNIPGVRETSIECKYTIPINELEQSLDKKLNQFISKIGYTLDSNGLKDSIDLLEKAELENRLNMLMNEYETLKDEYTSIMEDRSEIVKMINMLIQRSPMERADSAWYVDELLDRPEEIAVQYINDDNYRNPAVVFAYTDEYVKNTDKFISLMCIDSIQMGRYDDFYLRIYPYKKDVDRDEIFLLGDSMYSRSSMISEAIYTCLHNSRVPGMIEKEAIDCYDWYKVINAKKIIEDLKEDDLYEVDKRLKECNSEMTKIGKEITKLKMKLGKKEKDVKKNLFDNADSSDFSDFGQDSAFQMRTGRQKDYTNVDPFATSSTEEDPMKGLEELSKMFQY